MSLFNLDKLILDSYGDIGTARKTLQKIVNGRNSSRNQNICIIPIILTVALVHE